MVYSVSSEEMAALAEVAKGEGRNWKSRLREMWSDGSYRRYGYGEIDGHLQTLRNRLGPAWLARFEFPTTGPTDGPTTGGTRLPRGCEVISVKRRIAGRTASSTCDRTGAYPPAFAIERTCGCVGCREPRGMGQECVMGMELRRYRDGSPKSAAAEILSDIVRHGSSEGWAGSIEELDAMRAILRPFNVEYVDDMLGEWAQVQS